eukprot:1634822-Rhodomonas_salina.1
MELGKPLDHRADPPPPCHASSLRLTFNCEGCCNAQHPATRSTSPSSEALTVTIASLIHCVSNPAANRDLLSLTLQTQAGPRAHSPAIA